MLIFLRVLIDLGGLGLGDILSIDATGAFTRLMHRQHNLGGFLGILTTRCYPIFLHHAATFLLLTFMGALILF